MNKEGGSTLTIRKSNHVTDGFKGYKATLFAGEMSYTEINIPLRKGDDLFLHGNKDAGCIGYFSGRKRGAKENRDHQRNANDREKRNLDKGKHYTSNRI